MTKWTPVMSLYSYWRLKGKQVFQMKPFKWTRFKKPLKKSLLISNFVYNSKTITSSFDQQSCRHHWEQSSSSSWLGFYDTDEGNKEQKGTVNSKTNKLLYFLYPLNLSDFIQTRLSIVVLWIERSIQSRNPTNDLWQLTEAVGLIETRVE